MYVFAGSHIGAECTWNYYRTMDYQVVKHMEFWVQIKSWVELQHTKDYIKCSPSVHTMRWWHLQIYHIIIQNYPIVTGDKWWDMTRKFSHQSSVISHHKSLSRKITKFWTKLIRNYLLWPRLLLKGQLYNVCRYCIINLPIVLILWKHTSYIYI